MCMSMFSLYLLCILQEQYYECSELPDKIFYKKTGTCKDHKLGDETLIGLVSEYNNWSSGSSYVFPKGSDTNDGRECMLFVRVTNLLRDAGMSGDDAERYMYFLGNRSCITCKSGVRADVVKGEFQCSGCRGYRTPASSKETVRKHAVMWLSKSPDEWCQNLKPNNGLIV
jgi:hypothetical protein